MLDRRRFLLRSRAAGLGGGGFLSACRLGGGSDRGSAAFAGDAASEERAGEGAGSRGGPPEDLSTWEGVGAQFRLDPELVHMSALVLASHLGARPEGIVLTRSTTEGLALVYHGLRREPGQEVLTTEHDHYATHGSVRLGVERSGASVRKIPLYERALRAVRALGR